MVRLLSIVAAASIAAVASADHLVTVKNRCASKTITPIFHAGTVTTTMAAIGNGGVTSTVVPEAQLSWRIFGQTGTCGSFIGGGCTLLECSFDNPSFRQCNLSRVDGFNVGVEFSWSDGSCAGNNCLQSTCDGNHAFSTPDNGGASLRQCNTPNVGMTVTFSCDF
ncbi:hypothetical protein MVEN_02275600 [Mycena venus]|uniref:Cyanovirin-N domain-containing protein n=1 Tax=Mycena venus TaxID=2733690 RepID=A0A8H6X5C7_9AGAR|nr:hypothetical protein MVEN_02275600 [Mycena venus]